MKGNREENKARSGKVTKTQKKKGKREREERILT